MFKNKRNNRNNICGESIARLRKDGQLPISQRALADQLQIIGLDLDKNAIQRIESGQRFVTDIELLAFAQVFHTTADALLGR